MHKSRQQKAGPRRGRVTPEFEVGNGGTCPPIPSFWLWTEVVMGQWQPRTHTHTHTSEAMHWAATVAQSPVCDPTCYIEYTLHRCWPSQSHCSRRNCADWQTNWRADAATAALLLLLLRKMIMMDDKARSIVATTRRRGWHVYWPTPRTCASYTLLRPLHVVPKHVHLFARGITRSIICGRF